MLRKNGDQALHGEADDVGAGTLDSCDEADGVFLGGVGPGFVQDVDFLDVVFDFPGVQCAETDLGDFYEGCEAAGGPMLDPDGGEDLVGTAIQIAQHSPRFVEAGGLAQGLAVQRHQGIGGDDDGAGVRGGDGGAFSQGVEQDGLAHGEMCREGFLDLRGHDVELVAVLGHQGATAGGG